MVSLSFKTVRRRCDEKLSSHLDACTKAKKRDSKYNIPFWIRKGNEHISCKCLEEVHGVNRATLRDVDEKIGGWVPAISAQELQQFEVNQR